MEENNELLAKAHSVALHLGKMKKAVASFNEHMEKLHKAHHDDMVGAFGKLHKLVGIDEAAPPVPGGTSNPAGGPSAGKNREDLYGDGKPKGDTDLKGEGTKSLVEFTGDAAGGGTSKTTKAEESLSMTKAETEEVLAKA